MASPHAAGAAAVLLQANPSLSPNQLRSALQLTARTVKKANGNVAPFWQVGYGRIDLAAAVEYVRKNSGSAINSAQATRDGNLLAGSRFAVPRSDFWTWDPGRATAGGVDSRTLRAPVASTTKQLKVTISFPSLAVLGFNGTQYTVTVKDAAGKVVGTTTNAPINAGAGTASAQIDLKAQGATYGTFTYEVSGDHAASDPDTLDSESLLGRVAVLQVAQLQPRS